MNDIKSLRIFGTIYLWIFVIEVLEVCTCVTQYRIDTDTTGVVVGPALAMKPYTYQIFDDYTDDLLNERNAVATPLWQTWNKHLYNQRLPLTATTTTTTTSGDRTMLNSGNSMATRENNFENLNDFGSYKVKNAIWPEKQEQQQQQQQPHVNVNDNDINQQKQRHRLQQFIVVRNALARDGSVSSVRGGAGVDIGQRPIAANIRHKQNIVLPLPMFLGKQYKTKDATATKNSKTSYNDANTTINDDEDENKGSNRVNDAKENVFPLKGNNIFANINDDVNEVSNDETVAAATNDDVYDDGGIANSNGNGNEMLNYGDYNQLNTNYMRMAQSSNNEHDRDLHRDRQQQQQQEQEQQQQYHIRKAYDKRVKPSIGQTPFLPVVSGGAMTNLGKFFRDLSKNVHVSEQHKWNAEEQKLLEGDRNFSNIHHHLTKPNAAMDEQTAEWIKAIRFYRPSQKIRSLVAMNPHGQWDHSSQFIDPNYMWVGLGK